MKRHLHIERLVLDGVALDARGSIDFQDVLRSHLVQLLAGPGSARGPVPDALELGAQIDPAALGRHTAASIAAALPSTSHGAGSQGMGEGV